MPWYYYLLIFWFAIINCLGALFICLDKHRARKRQWRVPERTLLLFAWLGGCLGVYLAMQLIRHKTQTKKIHHRCAAYIPGSLIAGRFVGLAIERMLLNINQTPQHSSRYRRRPYKTASAVLILAPNAQPKRTLFVKRSW